MAQQQNYFSKVKFQKLTILLWFILELVFGVNGFRALWRAVTV